MRSALPAAGFAIIAVDVLDQAIAMVFGTRARSLMASWRSGLNE